MCIFLYNLSNSPSWKKIMIIGWINENISSVWSDQIYKGVSSSVSAQLLMIHITSGPCSASAAQRGRNELPGHWARHCSTWWEGPHRVAGRRGYGWWHLHHQQWRCIRVPLRNTHHQPTAVGHFGHARNLQQTGCQERTGKGALFLSFLLFFRYVYVLQSMLIAQNISFI